jgi:hypothetical protein
LHYIIATGAGVHESKRKIFEQQKKVSTKVSDDSPFSGKVLASPVP